MAVEVETPEDYAGTVMGDLSSRRGMVPGMDDIGRRRQDHQGGGAAVGDVRVLDLAALGDARPRAVRDGVRALLPRRRRTWRTRS